MKVCALTYHHKNEQYIKLISELFSYKTVFGKCYFAQETASKIHCLKILLIK
jgi:hypothetical protein